MRTKIIEVNLLMFKSMLRVLDVGLSFFVKLLIIFYRHDTVYNLKSFFCCSRKKIVQKLKNC